MSDERVRLAAELYADRRDRDAIFGGARAGFGEPAWDMLLRLYVADAGRLPVPVNSLVRDAAVGEEVARPYVTWLASQGLATIEGEGDQAATVALADAGRVLMDEFLERRCAGHAGKVRMH